MKKWMGFFACAVLGMMFFAGPLYAPLVADTQVPDNSGSSDTSVVDLSDFDTDQPVQSPSFENTVPAGQAPGQPIE